MPWDGQRHFSNEKNTLIVSGVPMGMLPFSQWVNALPDFPSACHENKQISLDQDRAGYDEKEAEGDDEAARQCA
jgi:hypothetical protein